MRRTRSLAILLASVSLAAAACSGGATSSPTGAASTPDGSGGTRVEVKLTDALRIEPATMTVPAGEPVTFVVTNTGAINHEFFVGDEDEQAEHGLRVVSSNDLPEDTPTGIGVAPGQTRELTMTFDAAGSLIGGCHLAGHYLAGMKADIEITE